MSQKTFAVSGMACTGCEETVTEALEHLDGVRDVDASHESDEVTVTFEGDVTEDELASAVSDAGYEIAG